jgi:hypothetical protein
MGRVVMVEKYRVIAVLVRILARRMGKIAAKKLIPL